MINIITGNCLIKLKDLPDEHFHTVITSPPYWGLRDYNTGTWVGGDSNCPHKRLTKISKDTATGHQGMYDKGDVVGDAIYKRECPKCGAVRQDEQLGLEENPFDYIERMTAVFREVRRVLRNDGTLWLNLGDTYSSYKDCKSVSQTVAKGTQSEQAHVIPKGLSASRNSSNLKKAGFKNKELIGIPWRMAMALQEDGWYLRQDIIWHKPNPMPESVTDRCTKSHEYIFLLTKKERYFYDSFSIKEDATYKGHARGGSTSRYQQNNFGADNKEYDKRNKRSVWTINTAPFKEAHFAVFPPDLIEPCVLAGSPEKACKECGKPYKRKLESKRVRRNELPKDDIRYRPNVYSGAYKDINGKGDAGYMQTKDLGLHKDCKCDTKEVIKGQVLDPFGGAGTTALVSDRLNREATVIELNKDYVKIAKKRLVSESPLFSNVEVK